MLVFLFAAGVWASGERRAIRLTAAALFGYATMSSAGLLLAPMDLRAEGLTGGTVVHTWATVLQGIFIVLALALGAFAHGVRFRAYSFAPPERRPPRLASHPSVFRLALKEGPMSDKLPAAYLAR